MNVVILCGGKGSKVWPYNSCRNKTMIPIGNKPILEHLICAVEKCDVDEIIVAVSYHIQEVKHHFKDCAKIRIVEVGESHGNGETLKKVASLVDDEFIVIYGDCLCIEDDLIRFIQDNKASVLVSQLHQDSKEMICIETNDHSVKKFWGHPRGEQWKYFAWAFRLNQNIFHYLETTEMFFNTTKVGVGSPQELYLENALNDMLANGIEFPYMLTQFQVFDIDKPWHIMEANQYYNHHIIQNIKETVVDSPASISPHAKINGHVVLGERSYIGDYVVINGNVIIGNDTIIDNGAIIGNGTIIGDHCQIRNHCKIGDNCSIGNECIIDQTAELLGGVLFSKVYLYHYGEYYGVIGRNTDLGAGTTVGTLRFDDGETVHCVKGKKQIPYQYSNACFIGDYSRTGVGAILLPGCKVGSKSVVGSGVILNEDVEDNTMIYAKQELVKVAWGDDKYGW